LGQTKAARFTPDEIGSYGAQPFDVTVNVVIKSTIDKAIEDAKYVLGLINDNGWLANGTVSQAAFDALNNALTAATTASGKPASAEVIAEINGALSALNAALGVVTNDLGEFITPQPVPGAPSGGMQQSSGPVSTTTVVNSKLRVTFNARGGAFTVNGKKVGVNTIEVDPGQKLSNLPKPTRENYRFAGWFYAKQKSTTQVTEGATITSRLTLRAKWHRIAYIKTSKAKLILKTMPSHKTMALKKDKKVYILGKSVKYKNYLKVRYGKKWGWVLKTSLVLQSTKYAKKATWVKKKASAKAEKLAKVKKNGKFTVIGVSGNYYQVKYKKGGETVKGYVPKKNLKKTAPTTAATAEEAS
jgi:uncharacterized repeat protein (TIGR02543 family)